MTQTTMRAVALALLSSALAIPAAAATPPPHAKALSLRAIHYSPVKLHTEFVVEVNGNGQVVLVKSGKSCKNLTFNAQTYGNVLQMWIRHPDGTAEVGLYRVTYDYDPKTNGIHRSITLLKRGGNWGNQQGAANEMIDADKKAAAREAAKEAKAARARDAALPSLKAIEGKHPSPTPHPYH